jgi:ligand-binding sensor domain-containing protein
MKHLFYSLILCLITSSNTLAQWRLLNASNSPLHSNIVREIAIDSDGSKWIATQHAVQKLSGNSWTTYTALDGYNLNNVLCVAARNGIVWVGTDKGLSRFDGTTWTTFNDPTKLPVGASGPDDLTIKDVVVAQNGTVWLAGSRGIAQFNGTTWRKYNSSNSPLKEEAVTALALDESGNRLCIATNCASANSGIYLYNYLIDGWGYHNLDGNNCVQGLAVNAAGKMFAGTCNRSGLLTLDNNVVSPFTVTSCVALNGVTADPSNPQRVWVATQSIGAGGSDPKGLLVYDGTRVVQEFNSANSALPSNLLYSVALEQAGGQLKVWVGTGDQGLAVYENVVTAQRPPMSRVVLKVLPNPATSAIEIHTDLTSYELAVFDNAGRLLHREQVRQPSPRQLQVQNWPSGLYHLRLASDKGTGYARFSKQ